jgi:hypothetical protein
VGERFRSAIIGKAAVPGRGQSGTSRKMTHAALLPLVLSTSPRRALALVRSVVAVGGVATAALLAPAVARPQASSPTSSEEKAPCAVAPSLAATDAACVGAPVAEPSARVIPAPFASALPWSGTVWSSLLASQPLAVLDRIEGPGLYRGEPARFSVHGASWTQNVYVIDGADVTDPAEGGLPLLEPDVSALDPAVFVSGAAPVEQGTPGVLVRLTPREPARSAHAVVDLGGSGSFLQSSDVVGGPPAIARLGGLFDGTVLVSGPIASSVRALVSARHSRVARVERGATPAVESRWTSLLARLDWDAAAHDAVRLVTGFERIHRPLGARPVTAPGESEEVSAFGAQARWSREGARTIASALAGAWSAAHEPAATPTGGVLPIERLLDGPVPDAVTPSRSRRSSASLVATIEHRAFHTGGVWHAPRAGLSLVRATLDERPGAPVALAETVGGLPARLWDYTWPSTDAQRHALETSAWVADRVAAGDRVLVEAGVRLQRASGAAAGATTGVSWTALLPRVSARLVLRERGGVAVNGGFAEYAHSLTLAPLAFGDPSAPHAEVYRWTDANGDGRFEPEERGPLVARVGPGAANDALVSVDPALRPPRTREWTAAVEASPGGWRLRLGGVDRREKDLLETVDVGAPASAYDVRYLPDPSGDIAGPQDDQLLPVYDRRADSFGLDRYVLTNPPGDTSLHQSVELRVEKTFGRRLFLRVGATASRTEGAGAWRGFRVSENDQGLVGELYDDPNAETHARGRTFFDRAFTIEALGAWALPGGVRLGAVVRYQDGQPFGRIVIVPDLAQGPEAIAATPRGQIARAWAMDAEGRYIVPSGHRFSYTLTVDARVEKSVRLGKARLVLGVEAFNLLDQRNEVEEDPVWGPSFRTSTALQPPRVVRIGVRLER